MKLRPYQQEAVDALSKHFKRKKTGCLVLPTGSGKTFTTWYFLKEAIEKKQKIIWVVHREYLLDQALSAIRKVSKKVKVTNWTAHEKDSSGDIVLAMVLSTKELDVDFHWLIYDECHRSAAQSYIDLEERIKFKKKLGLTATSERLDEKDLRLGDIVYQIKFGKLVEDGYLAKPEMLIVKTNQTLQYTTGNGDISRDVLSEVNNTTRNGLIVDGLINSKEAPGKTLIFCVDIEHAIAICAGLRGHGALAEVIHSKMPKEQRNTNLKNFEENKIQFLCNCEVFTEGYDLPDIESIVMARPTLSKLLWVQMVGRGARPIPGKKDTFKLWVFLDDIDKFSWLIREWALTEMNESIDSKVANPKERIEKVEKAYKDLNCIDKLPKAMVERLKVIGIIRTCGTFKGAEPEAHHITEERYQCIEIMQSFFKKFTAPKQSNRSLLKDYIEMSYAFCVMAGEFPTREWKSIAWAYYWKTIGKREFNSAQKSIWAANWIYKPDISTEKTQKKFDQNLNLVRKFNTKANNRLNNISGLTYIRTLNPNMPPNIAWIWRTIREVRIQNRCIIIQSSEQEYKMVYRSFLNTILDSVKKDLDDDNITLHYRLDK